MPRWALISLVVLAVLVILATLTDSVGTIVIVNNINRQHSEICQLARALHRISIDGCGR